VITILKQRQITFQILLGYVFTDLVATKVIPKYINPFFGTVYHIIIILQSHTEFNHHVIIQLVSEASAVNSIWDNNIHLQDEDALQCQIILRIHFNKQHYL